MNVNAKAFVPNPAAAVFTPQASVNPTVAQPPALHGGQNAHTATRMLEPSFPISTEPRDNRRVYAMDVECIATGPGHAARSPCSVVIVDYHLNKVLDCIIKPEMPVFNYLTGITGFKEGDLDAGESLEVVLKKVKQVLGADCVLVGQSVMSDVAWMELKEGVDFHSIGELSTAFGVFQQRYNCWSYFSLEHEALYLLGVDLIGKGYHDPAEDAAASMELYKLYVEYQDSYTSYALFQARQVLSSNPTRPSFAKRCNYMLEGVCMAAYTPVKCKCGDPTLAVIPPNPFTGASSAPAPAAATTQAAKNEVATTDGTNPSEAKETGHVKEAVIAEGSDTSEAKETAQVKEAVTADSSDPSEVKETTQSTETAAAGNSDSAEVKDLVAPS